MLRPLDRVSASMYLSEVRDLVVGIQISSERIETLGREWCEQQLLTDAIGAAPADSWDVKAHSAALVASGAAQTDAFMLFEALLAQWARLSLLLYPIVSKNGKPEWRRVRGETLRNLVDLPKDSILADREARDAWMHFDERLDRSVEEGWLGNRQTFVRSRSALDTAAYSVRVLDLESLALYYRDRTGAIQSISLAAMRRALGDISTGLETVGSRLSSLPDPVRRGGLSNRADR